MRIGERSLPRLSERVSGNTWGEVIPGQARLLRYYYQGKENRQARGFRCFCHLVPFRDTGCSFKLLQLV